MNSYLPTSTTIAIAGLICAGWFLTDIQARFVVDAASIQSNNPIVARESEVDLSENLNSPDIATNWFTGNSSSVSSQLPLAQTRKSDEDEHIAQGRLVGQSFGNDRP